MLEAMVLLVLCSYITNNLSNFRMNYKKKFTTKKKVANRPINNYHTKMKIFGSWLLKFLVNLMPFIIESTK